MNIINLFETHFGEGPFHLKTKGVWQGNLHIDESTPKQIKVGQFSIDSILFFLTSKRVVLTITMSSIDKESESGELTTVGKLEYDEKKKEFIFEKYPLLTILEGFQGKHVTLKVEVDQSVLSSRM